MVRALLAVVSMLLSTCVHEYCHALAAYKLGDDYAARLGRLTLNPLAHADPIGTIALPALGTMMWGGAFGWGKPVPYIPNNLSRRFTMRAGEAIIAFAGPCANLVMAIVVAGLWVGLGRFGLIGHGGPLDALLRTMLSLNISLFFFNLLPLPPLDGSKIVAYLFGPKADGFLDTLSGSGNLGLLLAIAFGGTLISPPVRWLTAGLIQGFSALFY